MPTIEMQQDTEMEAPRKKGIAATSDMIMADTGKKCAGMERGTMATGLMTKHL